MTIVEEIKSKLKSLFAGGISFLEKEMVASEQIAGPELKLLIEFLLKELESHSAALEKDPQVQAIKSVTQSQN